MFDAPPEKIAVAFVLALWLSPYVVTTLHEFGHAFWAVRKTRGEVFVLLCGAKPGSRARRFGRVTLGLGTGGRSCVSFDERKSLAPKDQAICAALGPLGALGGTLILGAAALAAREHALLGWLLAFGALFGLVNTISDVVPRRSSRRASDGWVIMNVARGGSGLPSAEGAQVAPRPPKGKTGA